MKKCFMLIVMLLCLTACSEEKTDIIKLNELLNFSTIKNDSEVIYNDQQTVELFKNAVQHAVKVDGIADVADPPYQFKMAGDVYFLWLHDDGGALMHATNTHTIYQLTEQDAKHLTELLNK